MSHHSKQSCFAVLHNFAGTETGHRSCYVAVVSSRTWYHFSQRLRYSYSIHLDAEQCRRINQGQMPHPAELLPCLSEIVPWRLQFWLLSSWSFFVKFDCRPSPCSCEERTCAIVWQIVALTTPHYRILPRAFVSSRLQIYFVPTESS